MATQSEKEVAKAIQTTESIASAGKMNPVQADKFVDYVAQLDTLTNHVRTVRFRNEQMDIDEVTLGNRVAMSHREASDPQKRRSVGHRKISIIPAEITVPIEISERYLAHNLQGESMEDRVIALFAKQFANDVEELNMNGNKLGHAAIAGDLFDGMATDKFIKDDYLALQDGWSKLAEAGNILDAQGANISPSIFTQALQELPEKYQRDVNAMRFLLPTNLNHKYNEKISARLTRAGDDALNGGQASSFGIPRVPVPLWNMRPTVTEHVVLNGTAATQLSNKPIQEIVAVTVSTLDPDVPDSGFTETTDWVGDLPNGTVARNGAGAIGDGATVKVTYRANPQMLFTNFNNLIRGIGMDITVKRGEEIFKNVKQYVMHLRAGVQIQNPEALVKVKNIGLG